jgi:hypothetical protein
MMKVSLRDIVKRQPESFHALERRVLGNLAEGYRSGFALKFLESSKVRGKLKPKEKYAHCTRNSGSGILISFPEVRPSMHRTGAMEAAANVLRKIFPAVLLLCLAVSGCGNSCYSFFWNGSGSGAAVSNPSCPLTHATGAVIVQMSTASAPPGASAAFLPPLPSPRDVQHIFVTFRGVEARPTSAAREDLSGWQELAPDLAAHPMQLDLLMLDGDSRSPGLSAGANTPAKVPADEYGQLRLRLVSLHPAPDDVIPESNACGNVGWNCIVFADRSLRPLEFDGATAEFPVPLEQGRNSGFRVLPDEILQLSIEFDANSSVFFTSNNAVHLIPVFRVAFHTLSLAASAE